MLQARTEKDPGNMALEFMGKKTRFKTLLEKVDNCARALKEIGVTEKDAVTICMPNTPHAVIMFYAVNRVGAIANMIHPLSAPKEIEFYMNNVDSKYIIIGNFSHPNLKKVEGDLKLKKVIVAKVSDFLGNRGNCRFSRCAGWL